MDKSPSNCSWNARLHHKQRQQSVTSNATSLFKTYSLITTNLITEKREEKKKTSMLSW